MVHEPVVCVDKLFDVDRDCKGTYHEIPSHMKHRTDMRCPNTESKLGKALVGISSKLCATEGYRSKTSATPAHQPMSTNSSTICKAVHWSTLSS
eukprot:6958508-Ditylum_brightwellii.AAC.1